MAESLIPKHGGYRKLKSFQVAELVERMTTADGLRHTACGSDGMMSVSSKVSLTADGL